MKPFWFAFNTAAWLSSKSVRMMSLAERGAYIGLLATAWGEDQPGTLPAAEDFIRRLSEMSPDEWKVSGPVILAMFPLADCGTHRYNPRLLEEAGKREVLSEKKADAGRKSAAKRAAASTGGHQDANTIPTGVEINPTGVAEKANQLQIQLQLQSTNVDAAAKPTKEEAGKQYSKLNTDPSDEQHWTAGPLTRTDSFKAICDRLGFLEIDCEHYRKQAMVSAEDADTSRTISQWVSWVRNFFNNQLKNGPLLKMQVGGGTLPSQPTARQDFPPPGQEQPGQVFYIAGRPGDYNMDKMAAAACLQHFPGASVVSLAFPQNPYIMQDGNVIRR